MENMIEKIREIAENLEWNLTIDSDNGHMNFQRYSSAGQDFNIDFECDGIEDIEALCIKITERYENFDVSEETYLWLDQSGHGANGAPYDMRDLYNDFEECESEIKKLYESLEELIY